MAQVETSPAVWPRSQRLDGLTAVVTGSARGIGRATALLLAQAGADVVLHARRSAAEAESAADEIRRLGRDATVLLYDLGETGGREALAAAAWGWRKGVDIWVNNAGADLLTADAPTWSYDQKLQAVLDVDVTATVHLTRVIGAQMKHRGRGTIVNIGWDQAAQGMAGDSGELFAASKGAIMAFTKSAALSLAPEVRVNCVAPGWIQTQWGRQASEYWQQRARRECQLGRWGTPQDVAAGVLFLASNDSSFLTGQVLNVNGGFRPR